MRRSSLTGRGRVDRGFGPGSGAMPGLSQPVDRVCYRLVICRGAGQGERLKVFVTGATGVLGRAAVSALVQDGHQVTGAARTAAKALDLEALGATSAEVSVFDQPALTAALAGFDAVANLATHMPVGFAG